ncbi:MAG: hypothetical protein ABIR92_09140 [Gemmatimonadaceae bacterium]
MTPLESVAERASRGDLLTDEDARVVLESRDLIAVGAMADDLRRRQHGARTTFVRVFEIHVDAPPVSLPATVTAGEFRIVGEPASVDAAAAVVRRAAELSNGIPVTGFALDELQALAGAERRPLGEICGVLREAGLDGIAEVAVDTGQASDRDDAIGQARSAGLWAVRLTVRSITPEDRVLVAAGARDLQARLGGFRTFAPLPRRQSVTQPSTGYDDVKQIALARLLVANIASIQVDWALYGPKLAQVALTIGADDVDAVSAIEPGLLGVRRSAIEEIRGNIRAAALEPAERNARFEITGA